MPWHEFECTGLDNEYVLGVDKTEEVRNRYPAETATLVIRCPDGSKVFAFGDDGNYKPEFRGFYDRSEQKLNLPNGYEQLRDEPIQRYQSEAKWASGYYGWPIVTDEAQIDTVETHKYGYVLATESGGIIRCIDRTNPNAKWDWWTVGGRYSGRLAAGYDPEKDPSNLEKCFLCQGTGKRNDELGRAHRLTNPEYTCNGCDGKGTSVKWPSSWVDVGNQAILSHLDLSKIKATRVAERAEMVEGIRAKFGGTLDELSDARAAYAAAHEMWLKLPEPRPRGGDHTAWLVTQPNGEAARAYRSADIWGSISPKAGQTISEWIHDAPAISAWAVVKDGEWTEKGSMGWWGMSSNDKDDDEWQHAVSTVVKSLPPTAWLSFVDCHI
jgi:hypothetical protein